jgi:hypothetical protein
LFLIIKKKNVYENVFFLFFIILIIASINSNVNVINKRIEKTKKHIAELIYFFEWMSNSTQSERNNKSSQYLLIEHAKKSLKNDLELRVKLKGFNNKIMKNNNNNNRIVWGNVNNKNIQQLLRNVTRYKKEINLIEVEKKNPARGGYMRSAYGYKMSLNDTEKQLKEAKKIYKEKLNKPRQNAATTIKRAYRNTYAPNHPMMQQRFIQLQRDFNERATQQ